ncbi:hypothetical protein BJV74DRAFT_828950 [Russula compacta]|nr:hypothetical protein BJV74DRAFT_828950 [Russula compacta]
MQLGPPCSPPPNSRYMYMYHLTTLPHPHPSLPLLLSLVFLRRALAFPPLPSLASPPYCPLWVEVGAGRTHKLVRKSV